MADRERYDAPGGKPGFRKTSGVKQDVKDTISSLAQILSPKPLKERGTKVDSAVDPRRQSTDHDY